MFFLQSTKSIDNKGFFVKYQKYQQQGFSCKVPKVPTTKMLSSNKLLSRIFCFVSTDKKNHCFRTISWYKKKVKRCAYRTPFSLKESAKKDAQQGILYGILKL